MASNRSTDSSSATGTSKHAAAGMQPTAVEHAPCSTRRATEPPQARVAFLIGKDANIMDIAGPWEVFQDVVVDGSCPFELFTVAPDAAPLSASGGLRLVPNYTFENAPQPDLIVVPAHVSTPASLDWLRQASAGARITLSVCTGAFHLAAAGLLDGMGATTHHLFLDAFRSAYPHVNLHPTMRFVDNGRIATAGGLTSGIDLALHIVERLVGSEAAARTARYLEYQGHRPQPPAY